MESGRAKDIPLVVAIEALRQILSELQAIFLCNRSADGVAIILFRHALRSGLVDRISRVIRGPNFDFEFYEKVFRHVPLLN